MKFNLPTPIAPIIDNESCKIGNVYACKGGGKTDYWIVVGISDRSVNLLGINRAGQVTSTANYGIHVFEASRVGFGRDLLGRCEGLEELQFDVIWKDLP